MKTKEDMKNNPPLVKLIGVSKIYETKNQVVVALDKVTMTISAGEIVVVMGPSGSGKTTLLNMIAGIDTPSSGNVEYLAQLHENEGQEDGAQNRLKHKSILTRQEQKHHLQNDVGIIFQFFNLEPDLTLSGNVSLPMLIADRSTPENDERKHQLIKSVNLENRQFHRPHMLSGGERQKGAIITALSNNPDIILADEPTGNVDSIMEERLLQLFKEFIEENQNKALVIVTHNPTFRKIADRTLILQDGRIIKEISFKEYLEEKERKEREDLGKNTVDDDQNQLKSANQKIESIEEIVECEKCHSKKIQKKPIKLEETAEKTEVENFSIICLDCYHIQTISIGKKQP